MLYITVINKFTAFVNFDNFPWQLEWSRLVVENAYVHIAFHQSCHYHYSVKEGVSQMECEML